MSKDYIFKLYALNNDESRKLLARLKDILAGELKDNYEIEVVDPLNDNARSENEAIFILPVLIKISPSPSKRVIGDLSDKYKVLSGLGIRG